MNNNPIGIFDSGVGGLSCVPAIKKILQNETIIYFGDNARTPYGSRSPEEILKFSIEDAEKLLNLGCKALAIACNTITAVALPALKEKFSCPIIGIIEPAVDFANKNYAGQNVGVIATEATVKSKAYPFAAKAAQEFVALIEKDGGVQDQTITEILDGFADKLDVLILGCTHFPFIKDDIKRLYPKLKIIDPAESLALELKSQLAANNLLADTKGKDLFLSSNETEVFKKLVEKLR